MSLFSAFKTDKDLESKGILFKYFSENGKPLFQVRLARVGGANKLYDQVRERVSDPYRRLQTLTDEMHREIALTVFSEAVVVKDTWQTYDPELKDFVPGLQNEEGAIVPATPETIAKVMDALPDLYALLLSEAMNRHNYKAVALEQDSKN